MPRTADIYGTRLEPARAGGDRHRRVSGAPRTGWRLPHRAARGIWTHAQGGFYHDGRFATLGDVIDHYDAFQSLGLNSSEKRDLVEFLKSL